MKRSNLYVKAAIIAGLVAGISISSCSEDEGGSSAQIVEVNDHGNAENASDIQITLDLSESINEVTEIRVMVVPGDASLGLSEALTLPADRYFVDTNLTSEYVTHLPKSMLDTEGNAIRNGTTYQVYVMTMNGESGSLSDPFSVTLEMEVVVSTLAVIDQVGSGGLTTDAEGNIYSADFGKTIQGGGQKVYRITQAGEVTEYASGFHTGTGNAFDSEGNMYQASFRRHEIHKVSADQQEVSLFMTGITNPTGIDFDQEGNMYIGSFTDNYVLKIGLDGSRTQLSGFRETGLGGPNGLTIDDEGNLIVCNWRHGNIVKFDLEGNASVLARLPVGKVTHIVFAGGYFYAVARDEHQIYRIAKDGSFEVFAGTGEEGRANGSLSEASFNYPNGITASPDGTKLYVNDNDRLGNNQNGTVLNPTTIRVIHL